MNGPELRHVSKQFICMENILSWQFVLAVCPDSISILSVCPGSRHLCPSSQLCSSGADITFAMTNMFMELSNQAYKAQKPSSMKDGSFILTSQNSLYQGSRSVIIFWTQHLSCIHYYWWHLEHGSLHLSSLAVWSSYILEFNTPSRYSSDCAQYLRQ